MLFANLSAAAVLALLGLFASHHHKPIDGYSGHSPIHVQGHLASAAQVALNPAQIKSAYKLSTSPTAGVGKTIAIVDAYDDPTIAADVNAFSASSNIALPALPNCSATLITSCFQKHQMTSSVAANSSWALEISLDVEWAHAIAPGAKILLVETPSSSGADLLSGVDYARSQSDVVAVSMSWGGSEFSGESTYDPFFTSTHGVNFFASSGDSGHGVSWPAVSPNVIGVGGTTLTLSGTTATETAWSGSGGGISRYVTEPAYQSILVTGTRNKRGTPDVSYDANPNTGFPVYDATNYNGASGWWQVGGTSAGAPQWAAIDATGSGLTATAAYNDAHASYLSYFRDITSGINGYCGSICTARTGYDFVTGLGSPITTKF